jgi:hypothetical protein
MPGGDVRTYRVTPMLDQYVGEQALGSSPWENPVKYLTGSERASFKLQFRAGKIYDAEGKLYDTRGALSLHSGAGRAIFVMDEHGNFYASKYHGLGEFHHSSLVSGAPVAAAGEIEVRNGQLTAISDRSGHYRPSRAFTEQALDELRTNSLNLEGVALDFVGAYG